MTVPDYLWEIVRQLIESTSRGEAEWEPTDRPEAYAHITPKGSVELATRDADGQPPYMVMILDASGREVESYVSRSLNPDEAEFSDATRELYRLARRKALRTDKVIKDLLAELRSNEPE